MKNTVKKLLTIGDAKTSKGEKLGYITAILYMAPYKQNTAGKNLCAFATKGCAAACLYTAGRGRFSNVQKARISKSDYFIKDKNAFLLQLVDEIKFLYKKHGSKLVVRLNGTTDIPFEEIKIEGKNIFEIFPKIQFYDYTKNPRRMYLNIPNYKLTFSMAESEINKKWSYLFLREGKNVAAVLSKNLYSELINKNVTTLSNINKINICDGDAHDLRFLDQKNSLVILRAKGDALKDSSGFVVNSVDEILNNL